MKIANWDKLIDFAAYRLRSEFTIEGKQRDVLVSTKQIKVIRAARQSGKSFNVAFITYALLCYSQATGRKLRILFGGPRAKDTRHIWKQLQEFMEIAPIQGLGVKRAITHPKMMVFDNGTEITNATTDDPQNDDIRGGNYDFLAIDEFGNVPHREELLNALAPALKNKKRLNLLMFIGTPDICLSGQEFDNLFDLGQPSQICYTCREKADATAERLQIDTCIKCGNKWHNPLQSWKMTADDCPNVDESDAAVMDCLLTEDGWLRENMAEAVPPGGKLFPEFNFTTQVVPQAYNPELSYIIGVDFGRNKPIVEFIQPEGDNFRIFHEISCKDIIVENLVKEIKLAVLIICHGDSPLIVGCDRAGKAKSDLVTFTAFSVLQAAFPMATSTSRVSLTKKENQTELYRKLTKQNQIFVDPECRELVTAFVKATPNKTGQKVNSGWKKVEGIDDPLDALIYGIINYNPGLMIPDELSPTPQLSEREMERRERAFFGG